MEETSASLLERLREPNPTAAWERFVHLYTPLLCHWAGRLGVTGPDVDDLVQEVFVLLLQKLPTFQYDASQRFRAWLWTAMLRKHRERLRRNGAPGRRLADLPAEPATPDQLDAVIAAASAGRGGAGLRPRPAGAAGAGRLPKAIAVVQRRP